MIDILNDFMELDNRDDDVDDGAMGSTQYFDDLFTKIESNLYPRCIKFSSLNFLKKLIRLKVSNNRTNKSFDLLIKLLKDALPEGNRLLVSHYDDKKKIMKLGLGYELIHICKYNYVSFWKEHVDTNVCPVCGTSRWVDKKSKGNKVPYKFFLISTKTLSKESVWL